MGNLLASAARGVAIANERDTKQKNELEKYDHQAAHAQTLEELRNKNNLNLQEVADVDAQARATTRSEHELTMRSDEQDWKTSNREDEQLEARWQTIAKDYLQQQSSGKVKSHGWSTSFETVSVPHPSGDPFQPNIDQQIATMNSPDLGPWVAGTGQHSEVLLRPGSSAPLVDPNSADAKRMEGILF